MKIYHSLLVAAALLMTGGCTTTRSTALRISGTPGEQFTARYRTTGGLSGDVTTSVNQTGHSSTVLKLSEQELNFDVKKKHQDAHLTAEIMQGGKAVFRLKCLLELKAFAFRARQSVGDRRRIDFL